MYIQVQTVLEWGLKDYCKTMKMDKEIGPICDVLAETWASETAEKNTAWYFYSYLAAIYLICMPLLYY